MLTAWAGGTDCHIPSSFFVTVRYLSVGHVTGITRAGGRGGSNCGWDRAWCWGRGEQKYWLTACSGGGEGVERGGRKIIIELGRHNNKRQMGVTRER